MIDIANGSLVKHVSLGIGKVVAVEQTAIHVFFPRSETNYAAKLRWPAAGPLLTGEGVEPDAWLAGLTSFSLDPRTGRYSLAANFVSHGDAIAEFLETFPGGFADPAYVRGSGKRERASRWRAASSEWSELFGGGQGDQLLAKGKLREVVLRARRVARHATMVAGAINDDLLEEALEPSDVVEAFFGALFELVSEPSPSRPRFEKLFAAADALGVESNRAWPMATLFPYLAEPSRHMLLLPKPACAAAARLGCNIRSKPSPNCVTYDAFRGFSEQLLNELRAHGARDFIDVEAFVYFLGTPAPRRKR